ncbi:hypothetical protein STEG23_003214, partial [Scotinomys teguina]
MEMHRKIDKKIFFCNLSPDEMKQEFPVCEEPARLLAQINPVLSRNRHPLTPSAVSMTEGAYLICA